MKKNPAIKEDNKARQFASVQRVVINNTSSGTSLWVPEETSETDELTVTENGVYCAYDDNVFGYSKIIVNVSESLNDRSEKDKAIGKITGTNPDTGDTESYGVDENGNLTKDVIPSGLPQAIHIVIAPTKKTYNEGESLDFTGIHVYLLDGEGHQWTSDEYPTGEIPFNELTFPVTTAESSGGGGGIDFPDEQSSGSYTITSICSAESMVAWGLSSSPFGYEMDTYAATQLRAWIEQNENYAVFAQYDKTRYGSGYGAFRFWAQNLSVGSTITLGNWQACGSYIQAHFTNSSGAYNIDSWYVGSGTNELLFIGERDDVSGGRRIASPLGATAHQGGDTQEIPVQWTRSDGETLEDSFNITVSSSSSNNSSSGGDSSSGGEHTGGDF